MRNSHFDADAAKQSVTVSVNADLYAKAMLAGIDPSFVFEAALSEEFSRQQRGVLRAEAAQDFEAIGDYVSRYGSFSDFVRVHEGGLK